jgi:hypothetical protein
MKRIMHFKGYSSCVDYDAASQTFYMKTFSELLFSSEKDIEVAALKSGLPITAQAAPAQRKTRSIKADAARLKAVRKAAQPSRQKESRRAKRQKNGSQLTAHSQ